MFDSIQSFAAEVAYLRRSCQMLEDRLITLDGLANGDDALQPGHHDEIRNATESGGSNVRHHIELAGNYADDWIRTVEAVIDRAK
ncbi:MAG: hypothetical protein ACREUM_04210, partial [Nitrosospira sp.]